MSRGFQASERIARRPEEVWAFLTDWEHAPRWMSGIERFAPCGEGPVGEGSTIAFFARGAERESTVATWKPPHQVTLRSVQGGVTATYDYRCEPEGDATRVTLNARCEARGFPWRLLHPLIGYLMRRADGGQIAALKREIEAS